MIKSIEFEVRGLPPAKSEAKSMLAAGHGHARRVELLLEAARKAIGGEVGAFEARPLALEVVVRAPEWDAPDISDATNYLGGIADVLEQKAGRGPLDHLGELAAVALYGNDHQLHDVRLRFEEDADRSYTVTLSEL